MTPYLQNVDVELVFQVLLEATSCFSRTSNSSFAVMPHHAGGNERHEYGHHSEHKHTQRSQCGIEPFVARRGRMSDLCQT